MDWKAFGASTAKTAASGVIGTLGDIAVSAVNNHYMKQQYQREVDQEQRTYERNRRDYLADLESERRYNSASAQLERLREAGLNPNLMGEGSLSAGISSSAQTMGNGVMTGISPVSVGNGLGSGLISMSTADVARSRADAQNASDYAYADLQSKLAISEEEFRPIKKSLMKAQDFLAKKQGEKAGEEAKVAIETAKKIAIEKEKMGAYMDAQIFAQNSLGNLNDAKAELAASEKILKDLAIEYQRVENDWQKFDKWFNVGLSVVSVAVQIGNLANAMQITKSIVAKSLKPEQRQKFINAIDEMFNTAQGGGRQSLSNQKSLTLPDPD